jgi:hypothetical protein
VRALLVVCLLAGSAWADELPTIDSEHPPTLRIESETWGLRVERVAVNLRSAPEATFVSISLTAGRAQTVTLPIAVPEGTRVVGLGVADMVWGRPMPVQAARSRFRDSAEGALLAYDGASAGEDHLKLVVNVPATIELALHLPPLQRLAIETTAGVFNVEVDGERRPAGKRRAVLDLTDIAGTTYVRAPHVGDEVSLVATPSSPNDFFTGPAHPAPRPMRDLDKAMIRRRMNWFRPGLRRCFMDYAQWHPTLTQGGVIVSFLISPIGSVEWAKAIESDLPDSVNACLVEQVLQWEFPAADSNVQVNYPLTFRLL